jgi:hypothetical protein
VAKPRILHLTTPLMHGQDVSNVQAYCQRAYNHWGVKVQVPRHGKYDMPTKKALREVSYGYGLPNSTNTLDHTGCTPNMQKALADPGAWMRTHKDVKEAYAARASWRRRLAKRYDRHGVNTATAYALKMARLHVVEHPATSNLGPYITDWERLTGYKVPDARGKGVYWCGCFCNAVLIAGGFPPQHFLGYVPSVENHAKAHTDGWYWTNKPLEGALACFGNGEHIEYVRKSGWPLRTVGGNTSPGNGSPNNGGGVYEHDFSEYHGMPLDGFAMPPWAHVN